MGNCGGHVLIKDTVILAQKEKEMLSEDRVLLNPGAAGIDKIEVNIKNLQYEVVVVYEAKPNSHRWPKIKIVVQGVLEQQIFWKGRVGKVYNKRVSQPFSDFVDFSSEKDYLVPKNYTFNYQQLEADIDVKVENVSHHQLSPSRLIKKVLLGFQVTLKQQDLKKVPVNDCNSKG